jgi:hypothetical protein
LASPFTVLSGKAISATTGPNTIMIEYDPQHSARVPFGEKIVLVQSVYRLLDGTPLMPSDFYGKGGGFDWKDATCLKDKDSLGMSIDALKPETQPYYNDSYGTEKASKANRPAWVVGRISFADLQGRQMSVAVDHSGSYNTLRYAEKFVTRCTDAPSNTGGTKGFYDAVTNKNGWKTCVLRFKVFAFCSRGLDCGTWYEGVSWEFTKTHEDHKAGRPGTSVYTGELKEPDADFLAAFALFNKKRVDADGFVKPQHVPCK